MPGNFILDNLTGQRFGLLMVVERAENDKFGAVYWRCICDCGEFKLVRGSQLRGGKFFTCGKSACRFWEKVHRPESDDACWEWTGASHDEGYGLLRVEGRMKRAHVFSFEMHYGPKSSELWVLHKCDNRKCVNPRHLFLGTHEDNMKDMTKKGRAARGGKVYLLREEKERLVERYRQGGLSHLNLAEEFGVSLSTVGRTLRGVSNGGR